MKEEHRCQSPESRRICANNCGFYGSPATMNLCSQCYIVFRLKEQQKTSVESSLYASSTAIGSLSLLPDLILTEFAEDIRIPASTVVAPRPNRCSVCSKRVGLTGFVCKCGTTFCGVHRYPEKHGCTFDFKEVGREEIAKANPVVKAAKLEKI